MVYFIHKHYQYLTGIQLGFGAKIGGGLNFTHFSGIVIHGDTVIGDNCTIFQGVTIGSTRGKGMPKRIGNNVIIYAGAKIITNVTIGDNVVIGANAVVTHDIPSNAVALGMPARVVSLNAKDIIRHYVNADTLAKIVAHGSH